MKTKKVFSLQFFQACLVLGHSTAFDFGLISPNHGSPAVIDQELVWTGLGISAHVLCKTPEARPIDNCLWTRTSVELPNNITTSFSIAAKDHQTIIRPGFSFYGKGLANGECGVLIQNVSKIEAGLWNCTLMSERHGVFLGTVKLLLWEKPLFKPEIDPKIKNTKAFQVPTTPQNNGSIKLDIRCCARGSTPDPTLHFQIGNSTVGGNYTLSTKGADGLVCATWQQAVLNYTMNNKTVHCIMDHISFTEDDDVQEDSVTFNIQYSPILIGYKVKDVVKIEIPRDSKRYNVSVRAQGNPIPSIRWLIQAKDDQNYMHIQANDNFELDSLTINAFELQETLTIVDANRLSPNESVTLYVHNNLGLAELRYEFTIVDPVKNINVLIIVLCVVATAFLLAGVIGGFAVFARRRHRRLVLPIAKPRTKPNRAMGEVATNPEENVPVNLPPTPPPRSSAPGTEVITKV